MIRAIREALDKHEHKHADNDGRAVAALLAIEPLMVPRADAEALATALEQIRTCRPHKLTTFIVGLQTVAGRALRGYRRRFPKPELARETRGTD